MPSSGMLRRAIVVRTDVSDELITFIIRVTRTVELGTTLAVTSKRSTVNVFPSSLILVSLMMEAIRSYVTSVLTRSTRRHIPEDGILHGPRRENLKSYIALTSWAM
jgi:hypothetical protein